MRSIIICIMLFSFLLISCNSTNKITTASNPENNSQMEANKMLESGFTKGTIHLSEKEGDCPITIKVYGEEGDLFYDPINISEDFKKEGEVIWFKFTRLRMMNRCEKANPIRIEEMVQ